MAMVPIAEAICPAAPRHDHLTRRCRRGEHESCGGGWSLLPGTYGNCLCPCHPDAEHFCFDGPGL